MDYGQYLDDSDESVDGSNSSEEEEDSKLLEVLDDFKKTMKRSHLSPRCRKKGNILSAHDQSSDVEDNFEREMNNELSRAVSHAAGDDHLGAAISVFARLEKDDMAVLQPKGDTFYDSDIDDDNQRWVDDSRRQYFGCSIPTNKRKWKEAADGSRREKDASKLPHSDAVLNCAACMTTLCRDCQRHDVYKDQYRAMFVFNCIVDRKAQRHVPVKEDSRSKRKRRWNSKNVTLNDGMPASCSPIQSDHHLSDHMDVVMHSAKNVSVAEGNMGQGSICSTVHGSFKEEAADPSVTTNIPVASTHISNDSVRIVNEQEKDLQSTEDSDFFFAVRCEVCNTEVAVFDKDEVYHFFNVLESHG